VRFPFTGGKGQCTDHVPRTYLRSRWMNSTTIFNITWL
jgi:hypothetical protein